jgi:hypothetical protein
MLRNRWKNLKAFCSACPSIARRTTDFTSFHPAMEEMRFAIAARLNSLRRPGDVNGTSWGTYVKWKDEDEKSICFPSRSLGFLAMVESFGLFLLDGGFFISHTAKGRAAFMELLSLAHIEARARAVPESRLGGNIFVLPDRTIRRA